MNKCYADTAPPIIAPRNKGPIPNNDNKRPPVPAIAPIIGIPEIAPAIEKSKIPKIIAGKKTASIAEPMLPAFLPPIKPAIKEPNTGNQLNEMDIKTINRIASGTLPFRSIVCKISLFSKNNSCCN